MYMVWTNFWLPQCTGQCWELLSVLYLTFSYGSLSTISYSASGSCCGLGMTTFPYALQSSMGMLQMRESLKYGVCVSEHWQDSYLPMSSVAFLLGTSFVRLLNLYDIDSDISSLLTIHICTYSSLQPDSPHLADKEDGYDHQNDENHSPTHCSCNYCNRNAPSYSCKNTEEREISFFKSQVSLKILQKLLDTPSSVAGVDLSPSTCRPFTITTAATSNCPPPSRTPQLELPENRTLPPE